MRFISVLAAFLFLGMVFASPFLGTFGTRTTLEQKFLRTAFYREFKCRILPDSGFYSVFKLANGTEVKLDPCCQQAGGLFVKLEPKVTLSKEKIRTLEALLRAATGMTLGFDIRKNCSSVAAIQKSKKLEFYLKPSNRRGLVACVEDKTGIPTGAENTAPEWILSYNFTIALPV